MIKTIKKFRYKLVELIIDRKTSSSKPIQKVGTNPFFIFGSGRNGSTLLARLLNNHSQLFLPPEQFALPYTIADWHLLGMGAWPSYVRKQLARYQAKNQNWTLTETDFSEIERILSTCPKEQRGPEEVFHSVFQYYSEKTKSGAIFGDHSPLSTIFYKYVSHTFPHSKFVFLIRHPFDVISSYKKIKDNPASNPNYAAWKWNNSINAYDYLKSLDRTVFLVRYEDLVTSPKTTLNSVLDFLSVKEEPVTVLKENESLIDALGASTLKHHQRLYQPIDTTSIDKWKKELSANFIEQIKPKVVQNAARFHYQLE